MDRPKLERELNNILNDYEVVIRFRYVPQRERLKCIKKILALLNEEEINKGEREAYDFGWRTGFKQGEKQERERIFNLMKENGQLSAMQIINEELFIPQTLRER